MQRCLKEPGWRGAGWRLLASITFTAGATSAAMASSGLPTYGKSAPVSARANPFAISVTGGGLAPPGEGGGTSGPTTECPHVCLLVGEGETAEQAIQAFEAANQCVVSQGGTAPPDDQGKSCASEDRIQYTVLHKNESDDSPPALDGYVPMSNDGKVIDSSGVTVGYGVDLGHQSMSELKAWGVDDALAKKLKPYLGLKGDKAVQYLKSHPLTITSDQADELDTGAIKSIVGTLAAAFDRDNTLGITFYQLPSGTQTALADFFYQHGAYSNEKYPSLWKAVVAGHWDKASTLMTQEPGAPRSRLAADAKRISDDVKANDFTEKGVPQC